MKTLNTLLIILMIFLCGSKAKLVDATSQEWAGGIYEAGYGTNYIITLVAKGNSDKLIINDLWIGEDYFKVSAVKSLAARNDLAFEKGDTVYVAAGLTLKPDKNGKYIKTLKGSKELPEEYTGAALLGYTWKGKNKFVEIGDFRKLEKIIYP